MYDAGGQGAARVALSSVAMHALCCFSRHALPRSIALSEPGSARGLAEACPRCRWLAAAAAPPKPTFAAAPLPPGAQAFNYLLNEFHPTDYAAPFLSYNSGMPHFPAPPASPR